MNFPTRSHTFFQWAQMRTDSHHSSLSLNFKVKKRSYTRSQKMSFIPGCPSQELPKVTAKQRKGVTKRGGSENQAIHPRTEARGTAGRRWQLPFETAVLQKLPHHSSKPEHSSQRGPQDENERILEAWEHSGRKFISLYGKFKAKLQKWMRMKQNNQL